MSDVWLKAQKPLMNVWAFLMLFPAGCALLVCSLMPDYFENISAKMSSILDMIELGRSKPWVVFAGMPYPATLRLFGDASGLAASLLCLIFVILWLLANLSNKWNWQEHMENLKIKYFINRKRDSVRVFIAGVLLTFSFIFFTIEHFFSAHPIIVRTAGGLALHVWEATFSPCMIIPLVITGINLFLYVCKL